MEGDEMSERNSVMEMVEKMVKAHALVDGCETILNANDDYELKQDDVATLDILLKMAHENLTELMELFVDTILEYE